jgi:hypothetical protein
MIEAFCFIFRFLVEKSPILVHILLQFCHAGFMGFANNTHSYCILQPGLTYGTPTTCISVSSIIGTMPTTPSEKNGKIIPPIVIFISCEKLNGFLVKN